jgi:hypothetical protein
MHQQGDIIRRIEDTLSGAYLVRTLLLFRIRQKPVAHAAHGQ